LLKRLADLAAASRSRMSVRAPANDPLPATARRLEQGTMHTAAARRSGLRGALLRSALSRSALALLVLAVASPGVAWAAKKKADKKKPVPVESAPPEARPPMTPTPAARPPVQEPEAPRPEPVKPAPVPEKPQAVKPVAEPASGEGVEIVTPVKPKAKRKKAAWEGFFMNFNVGYATAGGKDGPAIPEPNGATGLAFLRTTAPDRYGQAVTTNRGSGVAAAFQIGYNIKGLVSLWADLSWHGSFGSKADTAGAGTASAMLGLHPLRFWRDDLPMDVKLYGGYGFFDILYYYETVFQPEATGKAWFGTAIPFGLSAEYRFDDEGVFTMGADLRFVKASYTKWVYNNDKDISSKVDPAETTFRIEPRLMFGWHF
jgi:hypothetical protein